MQFIETYNNVLYLNKHHLKLHVIYFFFLYENEIFLHIPFRKIYV